jgi:hypothetical protein
MPGGKIFCRKLPTAIYDRSVSTLLENVWRGLIVSLLFFIYLWERLWILVNTDVSILVLIKSYRQQSWKTLRSNKKLENSVGAYDQVNASVASTRVYKMHDNFKLVFPRLLASKYARYGLCLNLLFSALYRLSARMPRVFLPGQHACQRQGVVETSIC